MPMFTKQRDDVNRDYYNHHHRYSYDPTYESHQQTHKQQPPHQQHYSNHSYYPDEQEQQQQRRTYSTNRDSYEDLFKQFEQLQLKAESLAEKDPIFASRLENLAKQFADGRKTRTHQRSSQPPPVPPPPQQKQQHNGARFPSYPPQPPNFIPFQQPHLYRPYVPTPPPPQSKGQPPAPSQQPPPYYANSSSFGFKPSRKNGYGNGVGGAKQRNGRNKHGNDNNSDYLYVLEDNEPRKITVQMSRLQLGPNGEKQRVIVERDFNNEDELNVFLAEFEENISKVTAKAESRKSSYDQAQDSNEHLKSPGLIVVEEPGEEPRLYRQDTGELVTDADGMFHGSAGFDPTNFNASTNTNATAGEASSTQYHHHQHRHHYHRKYYSPSTPPTVNVTTTNGTKQNGAESNTIDHNGHTNGHSSKQRITTSGREEESVWNSEKTPSNTDSKPTKLKSSLKSSNKNHDSASSESDDSSRLDETTHKSRRRNDGKNQTSSSEEQKYKRASSKKAFINNDESKTPDSTSSQTHTTPSQFTSRVGYRQSGRPNFFKSQPNFFMPPPHPPIPPHPHGAYAFPGPQLIHTGPMPQMQPPPPPHHLSHFHLPTYGRINFLNSRFGYQANMKPRSESHVFNTPMNNNNLNKEDKNNNNDTSVHTNVSFDEATIKETSKKFDKRPQQMAHPLPPAPQFSRRSKYSYVDMRRSMRHIPRSSIYASYKNLPTNMSYHCIPPPQQQQQQQPQPPQLTPQQQQARHSRRLDRILSYSSVSKARQRQYNSLKRDLSRLYRKNPMLYHEQLKGFNKSAVLITNKSHAGLATFHQQQQQQQRQQQHFIPYNHHRQRNKDTIYTNLQQNPNETSYRIEEETYKLNNNLNGNSNNPTMTATNTVINNKQTYFQPQPQQQQPPPPQNFYQPLNRATYSHMGLNNNVPVNIFF